MKATLLVTALLFAAAGAKADGPTNAIPELPSAIKADGSDSILEELASRFAATKDLPVPEPAKAPFDADPAARQAYLDEYRSAYRQVFAGFEITGPLAADTPHRDAVEAGHSDGTLAAKKQRALQEQGPSLEEVARRFATTKDLPVPEPAKTPFDGDLAARQAYLVQYRRAYRQVAAGFVVECEPVANTPYRDAVLAGDSGGTLAAMEPVHDEPTKTPFDADPAARQAYLAAYRVGYRQVAAGLGTACCWAADTPHHDAVLAGHTAGMLDADKHDSSKDNGGVQTSSK